MTRGTDHIHIIITGKINIYVSTQCPCIRVKRRMMCYVYLVTTEAQVSGIIINKP